MPSYNEAKLRKAMQFGQELVGEIIQRGGRCMEQVIDREYALYFERWLLPNGVSVVAVYNDSYREVFIEATPRQNSWDATRAALDAAAKVGA